MADTKIKITEVQTTETVSSGAYALITQDNNGTETLYRAPIQDAFPTRASFAIVLDVLNAGNYSATFRLGNRNDLYDMLAELPYYEDEGSLEQAARANGVISVTISVSTPDGSYDCEGFIDGYMVTQSDKYVSFQPLTGIPINSQNRTYLYSAKLQLIDTAGMTDSISYTKYQLTAVNA